MRTLHHLQVTLLLALGLFACVPSASAQSPDTDERARLHFQSGRSYFDAGDYARALQEFQQAYALSQREGLHYNLFLCQERLGHTDEAIAELEAFLATDPPDRAVLEPRLTALRVRQAQEAEEAQAEAAAEEARIAAERRAAEAEARARAAEAQSRSEEPAAPGEERVHPAAWVGYGLGAAGLATFAVAGGMVLANDGDFSRGCLAAGTCSAADLDRQDRRALIADIGLGVGLVGAIGGLVVHLLTRPAGDDTSSEQESDSEALSASASVTPVVGRGVVGVGVVGTF